MATDPSERVTGDLVVLTGRPLAPGDAWDDATKARLRELWATVAGRDAAAAVRLFTAESEPGTPAPSERTVRYWVQRERWDQWGDDLWTQSGKRALYTLQSEMLANFMLAQRVLRDAMTGAYAGREAEGVLALKAAELSGRMIERGVLPLAPIAPPVEPTDTTHLPREAREAVAMAGIVRQAGRRGG